MRASCSPKSRQPAALPLVDATTVDVFAGTCIRAEQDVDITKPSNFRSRSPSALDTYRHAGRTLIEWSPGRAPRVATFYVTARDDRDAGRWDASRRWKRRLTTHDGC